MVMAIAATSFAHTLTTAANPCGKGGYVKVQATQFTYDGLTLDRVNFYITSNGQNWGTHVWDTTFYLTSSSFTFYAKLVSPTIKIWFSEDERNNTHSNWNTEYSLHSASITSPCVTAPVLLTNYNVSKISGTTVKVMWTTTSEENNSHFIIQGSNDGLNFKDLAIIFSYTESGNSSVSHDYSYTFDSNVQKAGLGIFGGILLVLIAASCIKRRAFPIAAFAMLIGMTSFTACTKDTLGKTTSAAGYKFIRLAQVDKDGTTTTYDIKTVN